MNIWTLVIIVQVIGTLIRARMLYDYEKGPRSTWHGWDIAGCLLAGWFWIIPLTFWFIAWTIGGPVAWAPKKKEKNDNR